MKSPDVAVPSVATTTSDEKTSTVHASSLYRRKVTVPVGEKAPKRVAVSRTGVPTGPPGEAAASTPGVRLRTVMVKVWHAAGATPLLAHTVVGPKVPAAVGTPFRNPSWVRAMPGGRAPSVTENVGAGFNADVWNWWR